MKGLWKNKYTFHLSSTKWLLLIVNILNSIVAEYIDGVGANINACENTNYTINWNYTRTVTNGLWSKDGSELWIQTTGSPPKPVVQAEGEDKIAYDNGAVVTLLNISSSTHNGQYVVSIIDPSDSKTYSAETTLSVLRSPTGSLTCRKVDDDIVASGISDRAIMLFIKFGGEVVSSRQPKTVTYANAACGTYQCCMSGSDSSVSVECYPGSTGIEYCINYDDSCPGCSIEVVCIVCIVFVIVCIVIGISMFVYIKVKSKKGGKKQKKKVVREIKLPGGKKQKEIVEMERLDDAARGPDIDMNRVPTDPPFTAYIDNFPFETTEVSLIELMEKTMDCLIEFFKPLDVLNVCLPLDRERLKGFGYVEFPTRDMLVDALTKNGEMFQGRRLVVKTVVQQGDENVPELKLHGGDVGLLVIFILMIGITLVTFSLACVSATEARICDVCLPATIIGFLVSAWLLVFIFGIVYNFLSTNLGKLTIAKTRKTTVPGDETTPMNTQANRRKTTVPGEETTPMNTQDA